MNTQRPFRIFTAAIALMVFSANIVAGNTNKMIPFNDIKWEKIEGTPLETSVLWGNKTTGPYAMYLKLPGGFKGGEHKHTFDYNGYPPRRMAT